MNADAIRHEWTVFLQAGRRGSAWRAVFSGTEAEARAWFGRLRQRIKAGHVLLVSPDNKPAAHWWSGRRAATSAAQE